MTPPESPPPVGTEANGTGSNATELDQTGADGTGADEIGALAAKTAGPDFDRLAGIYRWMELLSFGPWLGRCRRGFLGDMREAKRALVMGDGDGRFTARLLGVNPIVRVDAIDMSVAMLRTLLGRAAANGQRVQGIAADLRLGLPDVVIQEKAYELVVTHFLLDCLTSSQVESLAKRVRPLLVADAIWVVSEFAIPEGWIGRWVARPLVGFLYWAFGWMTGLQLRHLPNHASALQRAGFRLKQRKQWLGGLLVSECWETR